MTAIAKRDPTLPVFDREEVHRTLGTELLGDIQTLVQILHTYSTRGAERGMKYEEPTETMPCAQCAGTRWTGQEPCSWCNGDIAVGTYRQFRPADAERRLNHLRSVLRNWFIETHDELERGIEVKPRTQRMACTACAGKVRAGWVACPHCGEKVTG